MIYEFAAKVVNIQKTESLSAEAVSAALTEIHGRVNTKMELRILITSDSPGGSVLVKSSASVSSMPGFMDSELAATIEAFKNYLDEIASSFEGEIKTNEAFYNNTRTFSKLYG
jgi:shikimate kinase